MTLADGAESSSVGFIKRTQTCAATPPPAAAAAAAVNFSTTPSSEGDRPYCTPESNTLGTAVHNVVHEDGYLNMVRERGERDVDGIGGRGVSRECLIIARTGA